MKQIIIQGLPVLLLIVVGCAFLGNVRINLSPFSLKMERPIFSLGFFFLCVGMLLLSYSLINQGKEYMRKKFLKEIEEIKELKKNASGSDTGKP